MKFITREEFADILDVTAARTYQVKGFPDPCKKITRRGWSLPMWRLDIAEDFVKSIKILPLTRVKSLNAVGVPRRKMAEILNTTTKRLSEFCRQNKIISLSTIKNNRAQKTHNLKIQNELLPRAPIEHPFNLFLGQHVHATPSIRSR